MCFQNNIIANLLGKNQKYIHAGGKMCILWGYDRHAF
jgi:hypothetical protein